MEDKGRKAKLKRKRSSVKNPSSASAATTGRKAQVKGKRPRVGNPSSTTTTGSLAKVNGKRPCVENPSSAATTVMEKKLDIGDEGHLLWFEKPGAVLPTTDTNEEEAPGSPYYVNLSDYEGDPGVEYELYLEDDGRRVAKVPRWARERRKMINEIKAANLAEEELDRPKTPESDYLEDDAFYKASVANGCKVTVIGGSCWTATN